MVAALSKRLDLFAVESTRRQNKNESLSRTVIARMEILVQQLRSEGCDLGDRDPAARITPAEHAAEKVVLVAEIEGHTVGVPGRDWKLARHYLLRGGLEPGLTRFMRRFVKPGMTFVDAGARIGAYTILAAVLLGGDGLVISLESDPKTYSILVWNLERNGLTAGKAVRHSLGSIVSVEDAVLGGFDSAKGRMDLLRIGAEQISPELLFCLGRISSRSPQVHIVLECCASLAPTPIPPFRVVEQLMDAGFSVQRIDADSGECSPVNLEELASAFSTNLVVQRRA
jgi:hypothetical protein